MRLLVLVLCALAWSGPALSQAPIFLWKNLYVGMGKEEFQTAIPEGTAALTPECEVKVEGRFPGNRLQFVRLSMGGIVTKGSVQKVREKCSDVVFASLLQKYGRPVLSEDGAGGMQNEVAEWPAQNSVRVRFFVMKLNKARFMIIYDYRPEPETVRPDAVDNL